MVHVTDVGNEEVLGGGVKGRRLHEEKAVSGSRKMNGDGKTGYFKIKKGKNIRV